MEKVEWKIKEVIVHKFYCDCCGKLIEELEDENTDKITGSYFPKDAYYFDHDDWNTEGYTSLNAFGIHVSTTDKIICKECYDKKKEEFIKFIESLGIFEIEEKFNKE